MKQGHRRFLLWAACCIAWLALGPTITQAQSPLIARSEFFKGEQRGNFRLSPKGDVLYFLSIADNDLHSIAVDHPNEPHALGLAALPKQWLPMDGGILLLEKDSLWHLRLRDAAGKFTGYDLPFTASKLKLMERPVPHGSKVGLWVEASAPEGSSGIWTLDLSNKAFTRIDDLPPFENPILDGKFRPAAGTVPNELGGNTLLARGPNATGWDTIAVHPFTEDMMTGGFCKMVSVAADGKAVYYTSNLSSDKTELYMYQPESHQAIPLLRNALVDILPFGHSVDLEGDVTSAVGLYAKTLRECVNPVVQQEFDFLHSHLKGDVSWAGQTPDGKFWLVRVLTGGPTQYHLYDLGRRTLTFLCTDQPMMEKLPLATRHAREVIAKDGTHLPIHVYLPPGSDADGNGIPDKPLPTILYVHGGPWVGVFHWNSYFHWRSFQLLANRGYAVINCEFRGSTGLGKEFIQKSYKTWGTDMLQDNVDVADWAVAQGIAQEEKVGIWGWSYGGYAAFSGPALYPKKYACALSMYGISDLEKFTRDLNDDYWKESVGDPSNPKEAKLLRKASAIHYVKKIDIPMLLTTGSKDDRIPQPQMGDMAAALERAGKEVVYFYYREEGHDYALAESWISFWAISEQFLAEHLGGKAKPVGEDLEGGGFVVEVGKGYVDGLAGR